MNSKFCITLFLLIFTINFTLTAQNELPEKYKNLTDTSAISQILELAQKYQYSDADSLIFYLNIAQKLSNKLNSKYHLMLTFLMRGGGYHLAKGRYVEALSDFTSSQQIATEIGDEYYLNYNHMAISSVYLLQAFYPLAEKHLLEALKYFEKSSNYDGIGGIYINMTFMNVEQKDYNRAKRNGELAYKFYKKTENNIGLARAFVNLSEVNLKLKNYSTAIENGRQALHYNKLSNQLMFNTNVYYILGETYLALNETDSSMFYFQKGVSLASQYKNSYYSAKGKQGIAKIFFTKNNLQKAIEYAEGAYNIADRTDIAQTKAEAAGLLADYYSKLGDHKRAFSYKNIESEINDSIFNEEKYKVQNEMEAMYQSQKKEQQIETLSKEKELEVLKNQQSKYFIFTLIGIFAVLTMVGLLIFRNNRLNAKRNAIELEQRLLRSQMNPHFIFNAVSSIQEFIMNKNPLEASSYLSNFAKLMRSILNNSATEFISVDDEVETLQNYLKLQQMRFQDKLEYEIIVPNDMETEELAIPPMLAQPFIENAIKHGIAKKEHSKGKVTVEFSEKNGSLLLNIQDNGVGLNVWEKKKDAKHRSMATKITQNRISNFRKAYKKKVSFEIENIINEKMEVAGTKVSFELPKQYL